ncbi:MAG: ATP-binding protein, partial [Bauldia litoralis]
PLAPQTIDVGRLVKEMEPMLSRTLEAYVDCKIETGAEPALALIDPGQLENALLNLAINARDAMTGGGTVKVRVRVSQAAAPAADDLTSPAPHETPYICVEVEDNGAGMTESVREHAFEPFFTTKEVGHGTGLGLAMVHGFVNQSGGFAEIDSAPERGTTVRLFLPTADAAEDRIEAPRPAVARHAGGGTALLIEENEMVRAVTERHLTGLGFDVVATATPDDAGPVFEGARSIDLVVTNLIAGDGKRGFDVAEHARSRWPTVGVVVATGHADLVENRVRARQVKAELIAKPFSREALAEAIAAAQMPLGAREPAAPLCATG